MAYSKRRYNKKRSFRSRKRAPKQSSWWNTASKALSIATRVASLVNAETKEVEVQVTAQTPTYNGSIASISDTTQGVGVSQHEGQGIKWTDCVIRGYCAAGAANEFLRLIIFIDNSNTITTGAGLLELAGTGFATSSPKNKDNMYNCKVLYDHVFKMNPSTTNALQNFHFHVKPDPHHAHIHYVGSTASVYTNCLKYCIISNTAAASLASIQFVTNMYYVDN